jgi:lipopolysaccharide transport system permease protein
MSAPRPSLGSALTNTWHSRGLLLSMTQRDLAARYRGSFGDSLWAVWNPLLQMATYLFVFGVVLQTRFPGAEGTSGYAFYLLAGMLPWLAFSEAVGRAPSAMLENRHLVKKTVFPFEIVAIQHVLSALVTQAIGTALFLVAFTLFGGRVHLTLAWAPVLLVPQVLLTVGIAWGLSAFGVFLRDLIQVIGPLLMLAFYCTPICYPEASLPAWAAPWFRLSPMAILVRNWRRVLIEGDMPQWKELGVVTVLGIAVMIAGGALFQKLRRSFADVL